MTIAERERQRRDVYQEVRPEIVATIRSGADLVAFAQELAERTGIPLQEVYRWIQHTEDLMDSERRRKAIVAIVPLWAGGALLTVAALLVLTGQSRHHPALSVGFVVTGLVAILAFVILRSRLRRD